VATRAVEAEAVSGLETVLLPVHADGDVSFEHQASFLACMGIELATGRAARVEDNRKISGAEPSVNGVKSSLEMPVLQKLAFLALIGAHHDSFPSRRLARPVAEQVREAKLRRVRKAREDPQRRRSEPALDLA
jgi:hypothetical protein